MLDRSLRAVAEALGEGLDVRLDWKATEIHYDCSGVGGTSGSEAEGAGSAVKVRGGLKGDETVEARRCIIATPITALKRGITFKPPLPHMKNDAIAAAGVQSSQPDTPYPLPRSGVIAPSLEKL